MKTYTEVQISIFYRFFINYIYNILTFFYPITLINKNNIYNGDTSCIYISRHTTHNYELLLGLFSINKFSKKPIRGLGHFLIYLMCPWYLLLGIVVGTRQAADQLIKNNEYLFIIPGGGEEMTFGSESFYKTNWFSKSKKYKTGFAQLAYNNNIPIIPIHGKNVEYMVFSPLIYIANYIKLTKYFDILMNSIDNLFIYKILFYIKMTFTLICGSVLVVPIPTKIYLIIGNHIYKKNTDNETLLEFTQRCEFELNKLINQEKIKFI